MAEPDDAVIPILRNIQDRLGSMERRMDANFVEVKEKLIEHDERFDAMENLMTFHLGLTGEHTHRLNELEKEMKSLRQRMSTVESR